MRKNERKRLSEKGQGTITCNHIWEISFLIYNKIPFLRTEIQNGKVIFIFPDRPEIQKVSQEFILNPNVRLQEYISVFHRVKNLIYMEKGKENDNRFGFQKG